MPNMGAVVAAAWEQAMATAGDPFTLSLEWWASGIRARINANGDATRQIFGLLTPTTLTDEEILNSAAV